jgi:hypothetical protein
LIGLCAAGRLRRARKHKRHPHCAAHAERSSNSGLVLPECQLAPAVHGSLLGYSGRVPGVLGTCRATGHSRTCRVAEAAHHLGAHGYLPSACVVWLTVLTGRVRSHTNERGSAACAAAALTSATAIRRSSRCAGSPLSSAGHSACAEALAGGVAFAALGLADHGPHRGTVRPANRRRRSNAGMTFARTLDRP